MCADNALTQIKSANVFYYIANIYAGMCCRSAPLGEDEGICIRLPAARTYTHAEPTHTYARLCFRSLLDRIMLGARCAGCRCRDCVRVCFRSEQSPKRLLFNRHASAQALRQTHTRTMYIRPYTRAHMLFDIHIRLGARAHMLKCCVVRMQSGLRDAQLERSPIQTTFPHCDCVECSSV